MTGRYDSADGVRVSLEHQKDTVPDTAGGAVLDHLQAEVAEPELEGRLLLDQIPALFDVPGPLPVAELLREGTDDHHCLTSTLA
ncbi:hypothetical protein [Streptomyces cyaneofuscatus]|uniref:hypothetical protein n=1 Tax=Streptomyces cyaneofuscatus TaxID=66883 RepID=UPI0037936BFC